MNNALLYLGGLLVMVLAALFAVPHFIDWNSYRGVFEEEASRVLGRDVRVGGAVNLRLLPKPYVSLEKLKIADPDSETGDSLLRAESFTAWLSVPPLLKGVIEANKIEIKKPVLQLVSHADGKGNWQNITLSAGHIPFAPQDVSLQSVHISEGTIVFGTSKQAGLARVTDVNGELSAEAIGGPYKFNGTLAAVGINRDVKISSAAADAQGNIRYKASVKSIDTENTVSVSGTLAGVTSQLTYDGDVSATLSMPSISSDPAAKPLKTDVTAKLSGDTRSLELKDMVFGFNNDTSPQTIVGAAKVAWPGQTEVSLSLNSKLLDIDRLQGGKTVPINFVRDLVSSMSDAMDVGLQADASVALDQVTLGGEALSGVRFKIVRKGGPLEVSDVRASMPGGTRAELNGSLLAQNDRQAFKGQVAARGQSLLKFLDWGMGGSSPLPVKADGPFMLEGGLGLSAETLSFSEGSVEIAGVPLTGDVTIERGPNPKVSIVVDGDKIDAALLSPGILEPAFLTAQLRGGASAENAKFALLPKDLRVRLRASELRDGDRHYKNVEADVISDNGRVSVPRLKLITSDGIKLDLEGGTSSTTASDKSRAPVSVMRGTVQATSASAVASLARTVGLRDAPAAADAGVQDLSPLTLAGALEFGRQSETAMIVTFDGTAGAARIAGNIKLDGGLETDWTKVAAGLTLSADSPDIVATSAALLALRNSSPARIAIDPKPGHLSIVARSGGVGPVLVRANVAAQGLSADIDGRLVALQTDQQEFAGNVRLLADDARHAMALAGMHATKGIGVLPLEGSLALTTTNKGWTVTTTALKAGETRLAGTFAVTNAAGNDNGPRKYSADLDVQTATVPGLLAFLMTDTIPPPPKPLDVKPVRDYNKWRRWPLQPEPLPSVWPAQSFDGVAFGSVPGTIKARFSSLSIEPGLALRDAELEAAISPGLIDVSRLDGTINSGELRTKFKIDRSLLSTTLKGTTEFSGGKNTGTVTFTGSGPAPSEILASLTGKGELSLEDLSLTGNSPAAIEEVAEGFVGGKNRNAAGFDVEDQLLAVVKSGTLKIGPLKVPVSIESGIARLGALKVEMPEGIASNDTTLDLKSFKLDSQWKIEPRVLKSQNTAERVLLAPITVVYSGKLKDLATLEPQIVTSALERELLVRRMERNVEELERLRKIDEAKAKEEKDRRLAEEAQRIKDLEVKRAAAEAARAAGLSQAIPTGDAAAAAAGAPVPPPSDEMGTPNGAAATPGAGPNGLGQTRVPPAAANVQKPWRKKPQVRETWKPFSVSPYQ